MSWAKILVILLAAAFVVGLLTGLAGEVFGVTLNPGAAIGVVVGMLAVTLIQRRRASKSGGPPLF